ncbi:MAG: hypothetical protein DDT21_02537 [Syntrophomonadaceae bacterium]|nr:hypothetical protein [Bacillota bacterium]
MKIVSALSVCISLLSLMVSASGCQVENRDLAPPPTPMSPYAAAESWEEYLLAALYPTLEELSDSATDIVRARIISGRLEQGADTDRPAVTIWDAEPAYNNIFTIELTNVYRTDWNPMDNEYAEGWEKLSIGQQIDLHRDFNIDFTMNDREYILFLDYSRDSVGWLGSPSVSIVFPSYQAVYIFNPYDLYQVLESPTSRPELALNITYYDILGIAE